MGEWDYGVRQQVSDEYYWKEQARLEKLRRIKQELKKGAGRFVREREATLDVGELINDLGLEE